jgi:hypothetical protein
MLTIKFVDGELVENVDWKSLPMNRVIRYMDYKVGDKSIRLMGYERYLRLKEIVQGVNVSFAGVSKIFLVGQNGVMCDKVTIDMVNQKIKKEQVPFEKIYNDTPIEDSFWRPGQSLENPSVRIIEE